MTRQLYGEGKKILLSYHYVCLQMLWHKNSVDDLIKYGRRRR